MMFWRIGAILFLFRWIFGDPKVDVRFLVAGAILPDVVDLTIGTILFADRFSSGEIFAHTLVVPTVVAVVILFATRRGRRRRAWMALIVAWFFHLLLDGMWTTAETFLWPFFGLDFPRGPDPYWSDVWERASSDPWRWVTEVIGLAYLIWIWFATGLNSPDRRARFSSDGRLPPIADREPT
jgi:membrane-bound metal-dependent hydrolase YbcI (DUF457 family)